MTDLASHHVLQRDGDGLAALPLVGDFEVRVIGSEADVEVVPWSPVEQVRVPVGGPYVVTHRNGVLAEDLHVGDLWVLAGQSNMQGAGPLEHAEPVGNQVRLLGMDRRWRVPVEPLHRPWDSPDVVHHKHWTPEQRAALATAEVPVGAGLGLAFANELVGRTGVPVGLIPCAQGGSSLEDWSPEHPGGPGHSLYRSMLDSVLAAGGRVAGLLWHQGESEGDTDERTANYVKATRAVFDALRRDVGRPGLRVVLAQIGPFSIVRAPEWQRRWNDVRIAQLDLDGLGADGLVSTVDLTMVDPVHLDTRSLRRLGRRFARVVTGAAETIRVAEVKIEGRLVDWPDVMETMTVRIRLSGVRGGLLPLPRVAGFSVRDETGALVPSVWRVDVDEARPDTVVVQLAGPAEARKLSLWHGWGTDPHCELVDAEDNAVPAFGPIPLPV